VIVVLAGVSGSGKSTIGAMLASQLGWDFEDGDALHPASNVAKMRAGVPLTDDDRRPWLNAVTAWLDRQIAAGEPAVVACSALKRAYRDLLREGRPPVRIVFLDVARDTLTRRLTERHGHFFPARLLASQLADLEIPHSAERCLVVPAEAPPGDVTGEIRRLLGLTPTPAR
jgi:gluconokinase